MLKISQFLHKYRTLVIVLYCLPLIGLFLSEDLELEMVPENPHLQFQVSFDVPARTAGEISERVTEPAEKVFNGLPGLISISSVTEHEVATIALKFKQGMKASSCFLNIQEKMDQVKLLLPRDVSSHQIHRVKPNLPSHLRLEFEKPLSIDEIRSGLSVFSAAIVKSQPDIEQKSRIVVEPRPKDLAINRLSVSDVVNALKSLGITTSIGRQSGVMFETGVRYSNIDNLKGAIIGARDDRPLILSDVANVTWVNPPATQSMEFWLDNDRVSAGEIVDVAQEAWPAATYSLPDIRLILKQSTQPFLLILFCFLMQIFVVRILKMPKRSLYYLWGMNLIVCIHFIFWKGVIFPPLSVIDLNALALTNIISSILLAVLYIRIRSYFMEADKAKPPRSLNQVKLFSLAELIPTFIVIGLAMWIVSLPTMTTSLNLPSRYILESVFFVGMPIMFVTLIAAPILTAGSFLNKNVVVPVEKVSWNLSINRAQWATWTVLTLTTVSFIIFFYFDIGVNRHVSNNSSEQMVTDLRGYKDRLVYRTSGVSQKELLQMGFNHYDPLRFSPTKVSEFTSSGMRYLPGLDLTSFTESLKDLQKSSVFGYFSSQNDFIPLSFGSSFIQSVDIPNLLFSSSKKDQPAKPINTLVNTRIENIPSRILRDNMETNDLIMMTKQRGRGSFKTVVDSRIQPSSWTAYLLGQFKEFQNYHVVSLIFIFMLFAIYLNSFIRSGLVVIFALATAGGVFLLRQLLPGAFHADCLWLLYIAVFTGIFQILVYTRVIDIERSRGQDRDEAVAEVRKEMATSVYLCSWTFVAAFVFAGLLEWLPFVPSLGFWQEGVFIGAATGVVLFVSTHVLFPIFYLNSEEVVNSLALKFYKFFRF